MEEQVAVFDMVNVGPAQRMSHAHIRGDLVHFHVHNPEKEPKQPETMVLHKRDLWRVMEVNYWKEEDSLSFEPSEGTNVVGAEVGLREASFRWKKGKQSKEDEVSFLSLRQVDARLRFRVRDVRKASSEELAGLPPGYQEPTKPEETPEEGEGGEEAEPAEAPAAEEAGQEPEAGDTDGK